MIAKYVRSNLAFCSARLKIVGEIGCLDSKRNWSMDFRNQQIGHQVTIKDDGGKTRIALGGKLTRCSTTGPRLYRLNGSAGSGSRRSIGGSSQTLTHIRPVVVFPSTNLLITRRSETKTCWKLAWAWVLTPN